MGQTLLKHIEGATERGPKTACSLRQSESGDFKGHWDREVRMLRIWATEALTFIVGLAAIDNVIVNCHPATLVEEGIWRDICRPHFAAGLLTPKAE